ncbi:hypothetical protein HPP92_025935 [Vanilla planifolia]|uniref:MYB transcription factor n=1 Tax=Vanilla planifolia TaxID=51239 RepID=A0A835PF40_VANPL|nr:hypothetical protein HPP92_025935 [Vanilla planifolia]
MNRRKHHKQWTTSEIVKLVDGVSCYGVGRWTEIKRLLFSTSTHRTTVDLKDKWRNLLKSCIAYCKTKNLKNAPVPQYIMRRVRELSVIHPYPRNQRSIKYGFVRCSS